MKNQHLLGNKHRVGKPPWNKGKKGVQIVTLETREKLSRARMGNKNAWKGGLTAVNDKIRQSLEYKLWRMAVFERDKYICIWCGQVGGKLQADHIKPFCLFPELRFAIDNGRTLCEECHRKTDTYLVKARYYKNGLQHNNGDT